MTIAGGGAVSNVSGYIGCGTNSANNAAIVTGGGSVWYNSGTLLIGNTVGATNNQLTIANGGQVFNTKGDLGYNAGNCAALVTGSGSLWGNSGILVIGDQTAGNQLTIANGGGVSNSGAYVGYSGSGNQLTITNGGTQVVSGDAYVGYNSGANNNTVLVNGSGSVWTNSGSVFIGYAGNNCTLIVTNGAAVSAGNFYSGDNEGNYCSLAVTGSGSVLNVAGYFSTFSQGDAITLAAAGKIFTASVGLQGYENTTLITGSGTVWTNSGTFDFASSANDDQLTICKGGALYDNYAQICSQSQEPSTMLVTDPGTIWSNATGMEFGYGAEGGDTLTISNGATAVFGGSVDIAGLASLNGKKVQMILSGGNINDAGGLTVFNSASYNGNAFLFNYGTLTTGGNGVITVSPGTNFTIGNTAGQTATWNILGGTNSIVPVSGNTANTILGNTNGAVGNVCVSGGSTVWTNAGAIQITNGTLTIAQGQAAASQYTQSAGGTLAFQLGGTPSNGVLNVSGSAQLGGTLAVTNLNGFNPALSNSFTLLTAQTVTGTFAATNLPTLGGGLRWQLAYMPASVVLSVVSAPAPLSALKFTASPVISGTSLTISATNTGAGTVYLLASTNVAAPINTWTPIWTNVLIGNGSFTTNLLNAVNPALKQQFYMLANTNNN
jgi:T5SS/PEP-CTERM-associated repeat protein